MPLGFNRVLGDPNVKPENRPHRVALASWPASADKSPRTASIDALISHIKQSGYDGTEFSVNCFARFFPGESPLTIARKTRSKLEKAGLKNFGTTLFVNDDQMRAHDFLENVERDVKLQIELGSEFVSFQMCLSAAYMNTGGDYRHDERYLQFCADRVKELRTLAWSHGLNYYNEVHVDRITEDPAGLCRILELADHELNGDLSHFLARGMLKGKHVEKILTRVQHSHVRMARMYGDLSAEVSDPKADWAASGVTWQLFQLMAPALRHGFSSRTLAGETGPLFDVKDALGQDATLVPLYRAMARYADAACQGIVIKVDAPTDMKPWG